MSDIKNQKTKLAKNIKEAKDAIRLSHDSPFEDFFDVVERMDTSGLDNSGCIRDGLLSALDCIDIAIYRHPDIEGDLKLGIKIILLALIEAGASVQDQTLQVEKMVRERLSANAQKAAIAKHNKPGGSIELRKKIRAIWAGGKYSSRDICAEEEWRGLGFGSFKAARNALINTPPPACAERVPPAV